MRRIGESLQVALVAGALLAAWPGGEARAANPPIAWSLRGLDGARVTMAELPPTWLLIYFGYSYCPDICPTALADLATVLHDLEGLAARVQPVFVTIDPARDTPAVLAHYVAAFDARILPLTGSEAEIAAAARQFDVHYVRYQDGRVADYSLDHSSALFLVDPQRILVDDFATPDESPAEIVAALRAHLEPAKTMSKGRVP
jgi:protein SCO1/2